MLLVPFTAVGNGLIRSDSVSASDLGAEEESGQDIDIKSCGSLYCNYLSLRVRCSRFWFRVTLAACLLGVPQACLAMANAEKNKNHWETLYTQKCA